jgi:hypothetical protein
MTNVAQITTDISRAIADAIGELVRVRHWDHSSDVTLPIFYPSGSSVSLCIEKVRHGYAISDNGLAYRELEQIGGETYFGKNASKIIEGESGVWHNSREILSEATAETLASAMADVASSSSRLTWKVLSKLNRKSQVEIADYLFERLRVIFGEGRVERDRTITGPSTREWHIDAVVHLEGSESIFQAVANSHLSVYPTAAMFHDLALIESPPTTISVVKSREAMGSLFNILAQAGNVIEEAQADQVYKKAVQLHF